MLADSAAFGADHRTIGRYLSRTHLGSIERRAGMGQHLSAGNIINCKLG